MTACLNISLPREGSFVSDSAGLLGEAEIRLLNDRVFRLMQETGRALCVVSVSSIAQAYAGASEAAPTIERLAGDIIAALRGTEMFDRIRAGALLVVAAEDRQVRIEMGAGWAGAADSEAGLIMRSTIIPRFKRSDFISGIMAGSSALEELVRRGPRADAYVQREMPSQDVPFRTDMVSDTSSFRSSARRRRNPLVSLVLIIVWVILQFLFPSSRYRHHSSSSYSGGSDSGYSSGSGWGGGSGYSSESGGGASGSW